MKKEQGTVRNKIVTLRMNAGEYKSLNQNRKKTTEKTNSNYLRKLALQKPVTVIYRNQSIDEFLLEVIGIKKELNAIGHNLNQAVHKLHTLDRIPEFRHWVEKYEATRQQLTKQTETLLLHVYKTCEKWSQE